MSTVGFVSGVAVSPIGRTTLLASGVILVFVEAFSMAVGSFLSDESVQQVRFRGHAKAGASLFGAIVMFLSYLLMGLLVMLPYWLLPQSALAYSIGFSLAALFALGAIAGRLAGLPALPRGIRMMLIGGIAIALGVAVGRLVT